jgi:hypothetical protein
MSLRTLLLHWNKIRGKGAVALAKGVKHNQSLMILDASFNAFGSCPLKRRKGYRKPNRSLSPRKKAAEKREEGEGAEIDPEDMEEFEKYTQAAYKWGRALIKNKTLVHIDFSFNQFKVNDVQILGKLNTNL